MQGVQTAPQQGSSSSSASGDGDGDGGGTSVSGSSGGGGIGGSGGGNASATVLDASKARGEVANTEITIEVKPRRRVGWQSPRQSQLPHNQGGHAITKPDNRARMPGLPTSAKLGTSKEASATASAGASESGADKQQSGGFRVASSSNLEEVAGAAEVSSAQQQGVGGKRREKAPKTLQAWDAMSWGLPRLDGAWSDWSDSATDTDDDEQKTQARLLESDEDSPLPSGQGTSSFS